MANYFQRRGNKYGAKSCVYNGIIYHSKKEAGYAQELDLRIKAGEIKSWRRQVKQDLCVNGHHITNYFVDFEITHNDDSIELIEVKGFETMEWKMKRDLLVATVIHDHPEIKYSVVK